MAYTRMQAVLAALSKYVWAYANALYKHRRWAAHVAHVEEQDRLINADIAKYGFWVSKDGERVDPALVNGMHVRDFNKHGYVAHGLADIPSLSKPLLDINVQPNIRSHEPWLNQSVMEQIREARRMEGR